MPEELAERPFVDALEAARIASCDQATTLERWLQQALTAETADEALR